MSNDDIVNQLLPFVMNEMRMPAGFTITVIEEIERLREENAGLVASIPHIIAGVRASVRAEIEREHAAAAGAPSAESVGDTTGADEIERLRAQVAELLPWAEEAAVLKKSVGIFDTERSEAGEAMLNRIKAGEFGQVEP